MRFRKKGWVLNSSIWRAVLSLFYPPVIIGGKNGKNSENPVGSNKSEKRKPKSAVYRSFWASVVYFHLRLISTKSHKREMTRNQFASNRTWVRIPSSPPKKSSKLKGLLDFPFLHSSLNLSIFPVRTARFCVRTACFFSQKTGFKSGSVILPCSVTFSQRLPKSSDLGRSIPCSMACAEDILAL